jgi:hypothetical protein
VAVAVLRNTIKRTPCILNLKYQVTQKYLKYKCLSSFSCQQRCLDLWVRTIFTLSNHFFHNSVTNADYEDTASSGRMTDELEAKLEAVVFFFLQGMRKTTKNSVQIMHPYDIRNWCRRNVNSESASFRSIVLGGPHFSFSNVLTRKKKKKNSGHV